ncbi:cytoskeleton-associated protein 2 [Sciurus carolinensis]|uniref:cytoskeleton-associated protein 2 n=1 Tax=Sciurus carolinensis TaxID=30640 RepID=UPI001FB1CF6E|nr:cytoskeleton-associated protein 2 [Sciurus carolinensis]
MGGGGSLSKARASHCMLSVRRRWRPERYRSSRGGVASLTVPRNLAAAPESEGPVRVPSSRAQRVMTSEDQVQEETKILKLKTKMADKENIKILIGSKNNTPVGKDYIPLKSSNELTNTTTEIETHDFQDGTQTLQLSIKDDPPNQNITLSQAFHLKNNKNNTKKKPMPAEKPNQTANMPKKPVLGAYRGQIVQSKVNSFRKPLQVKNESSATTKQLPTTVSKATKPEPINTTNVTVRSNTASNTTATTKFESTKFVNTKSRNTQLVRPPIRNHYNNTWDTMKQGISQTPVSVKIRKGPQEKEFLQPKMVKTSSQPVKRNGVLSRSIAPEIVARPASSSNTKLIQKSKTIDQRRYTIAKSTIDRSAQPKETAEERKARLSEWKTSKGKVLKRPSNSVVTQPMSEGQNEKPIGSFWTTMAEEDEQRLFTEKVNKTISECLNLINKGCPKEEILVTLNDLIKNIPDAKKLVKYWICLVRIEPITSPIENIISIYEKAILAGAQPIEEMRHVIVDILTMKSQEKVNLGENIETYASKEQVQEVNTKDIGVNLEPEKPEIENKHHRNVVFKDYEEEQDDKMEDPTNDVKTPDTETRASCLIKYNVSTTPYLQSIKKKMQLDESNSAFKELKFLTPVRRSRRLQDKTSKLPDMLKDHYPCVSSLEQLSELGGKTDAFVCRPNAALCPMYSETDTQKN